MDENIWGMLNMWLRKKFKETFTTDGAGDTAIRVAGQLEVGTTEANTEEILNEVLLLADTEYTITLPSFTQRYTIFTRDRKKMQLAYVAGETDTNYLTILPGDTHDSSRLDYLSAKTLYLKTSSSNIEVEIKLQRKL